MEQYAEWNGLHQFALILASALGFFGEAAVAFPAAYDPSFFPGFHHKEMLSV
jgi:hypothetical protein